MADIFAKITAFFQKFLALIKALFSGKRTSSPAHLPISRADKFTERHPDFC